MSLKPRKKGKRGWSDTDKGKGTFNKRNGMKRRERDPIPYDPRDEFDEIDQAILDDYDKEMRNS